MCELRGGRREQRGVWRNEINKMARRYARNTLALATKPPRPSAQPHLRAVYSGQRILDELFICRIAPLCPAVLVVNPNPSLALAGLGEHTRMYPSAVCHVEEPRHRWGGGGVAASVIVSALTSGFGSASISFALDVDPSQRKRSPEFYGYIPDGASRTVVFGCMLLNSSLMLFVRGISTAIGGGSLRTLYTAVDMTLFFSVKALRGDCWTFLPIHGAAGIAVSLLVRVLEKTIVDYTGLVELRDSLNMGGLGWSLNMVLALVASFVRGRGEAAVGFGGRDERRMGGGVWRFFGADQEEVQGDLLQNEAGQGEVHERVSQGRGGQCAMFSVGGQ